MKIAYNPTTAAALTSAPSNNDIVFDLSGVAIYARGIKFDGKAYSVFKKHTSANSGGYNGLVPVPSYTISSTRFLREDGTWVVPTNTKYSVVTSSADGLVPKFDAVDGTIDSNSNDWVLTNNNGAIGWYKLPANAFLNNTYSSLSEFSLDSTHRLVTDTQIANWNAVYNIMTTDSDTVINKWQEVVDFLATYTEADTLSNLLNNKVNKDLIVTSTVAGLAPAIGTAVTSTIGSLANEWVLTSTKGAEPTWRKLPSKAFSNTTYSAGTGLSLSGTTFSNTGVLSVEAGSKNGTISVNGADVSITGLGSAAYTNSSSYAAASHTHTKSQITDFPTSMPASDVYSWAKASSKPSYSWSEITSKPTTFTPASHTHNYVSTITIGSTEYNVDDNNITIPAYPTSLKSPKALKAGSKSYDGSAEVTITASDLGALTSHQSIYNLTLLAGTFSAVTFDPNGGAKTVNIPTSTSHISEGSNLYFTSARAVAAITGGASTIATSNLTASRALISNSDGKVAVSAITSTELSYLDGVSSNIQTLLNNKSNIEHTHNYAGSSSAGGAASSANKLNTNAGSSTKPVYFSGGVPVACGGTLSVNISGNAASVDGYSISVGSSAGSDANTIYFVI